MLEFGYLEFREYLENLNGDKPFECPNLRILPEEVKNSGEMMGSYEKGALICIGTVGSVGPIASNNRCYFIGGSMILNDEKNLEVICGWKNNTIILSVKDFQLK